LEHSAENIAILLIQIAIIFVSAKIAGEICTRILRIPSVLGELAVGIIISPFALGAIKIPLLGSLSGGISQDLLSTSHSIPMVPEIWFLGQIGAVILLFTSGLETDLKLFLKYSKQATMVAIGGMALPFVLGLTIMVLFGYSSTFSDTQALFMGIVLTATSIGITVRVLSELKKLNSPEGITVLGAAVLDDVLGILLLTIIVGMTSTTEKITLTYILIVIVKTLGFWLGLTIVGKLLSNYISKIFAKFHSEGATVILSLSLAFISSGVAEFFGLAMIIGAFSIGIALSGSELAKIIEKPMHVVYAIFVPIFFVTTGMLVDLSMISSYWQFGLALSIAGIIGKILGSGVSGLLAGFKPKESLKIGVGMLPRGEVALIMAAIGISSGALTQNLYGAVIMMTFITTALAPILLAYLYKTDK
jgi:Kef-type K+ transport system membrane component KefB